MSGSHYSVKFLGHSTSDGHTTYTIKVSSPYGDTWIVRKRYREIRELHEHLQLYYGERLPPIPGRRLWGNHAPAFLEARQVGLQEYLLGVLRLDRDLQTPELKEFLGNPETLMESSQAAQYQEILDNLQKKLLNLALPPGLLDDSEMAHRVKVYGQAMRLHVLSQPVDPIHLRGSAFDSDPVQFCAHGADQLESMKSPASNREEDVAILHDLLDGLGEVLNPPQPAEMNSTAERLVVPFPPISS